MAADLLFSAWLRAQLAASFAIALVLVLRFPARRLIGAELAYLLWSIVPIAAVVSLFPSFSEFSHAGYLPGVEWLPVYPPHQARAALLLEIWGGGMLVAAMLMALGEAAFRRAAAEGRAGPAVMGISWPRLVTPADYAERFDAHERELIGRHERTHIARRDPIANLVIATARALGWFNPLVHLAATCARLDQELACDAAVIAAWPQWRRDYGATLLKAHLAGPRSAFACAWLAQGRHPLEVRLSMLARPSLSLAHYLRGAAAVGLSAFTVAVGVWGFAPGGLAHTPFEWSLIQPR
jgi:beta-lactamase regulating signal transducer with metallopeptidase domain